MKYEIEKDPYVGKFILWEVHRNYKIDLIHGTEKECKKLKKKLEKEGK